ncbi:MAG: Zn-dependent hydrolase [Dehalococcoidia bacterium]|nr:Zn-dependent hydrolase [Dehalococcoidia bacterium]MDW8119225.1 Zn-dependent hydrolase [Chloroflexota bacterium]
MALPYLEASPQRLERDLMALARFTQPDLPYTRLAFSAEDRQARQWVVEQMQALGLTVRIDPAANIIGRREGQQPHLPVLMTGSHIDTVRAGGRFDGMVGVVGALEVVRLFNRGGIRTRHPLEVVVFTCEEPTAYGFSPFGSRAMAGQLDIAQVHTATFPDGRRLVDLLRGIGGDPDRLAEARLDPARVLCHLELHIEQGAVMERQGLQVGVVTAIAAPCRAVARFRGRADHAGATPMDERADALCAAAELVLCVERLARSYAEMVGTVGFLQVHPNMVNVIPGRVDMHLEVRSTSAEDLTLARTSLEKEIHAIGRRRGVETEFAWTHCDEPVTIPPRVRQRLEQACQETGVRWAPIVSRASHDSARLAAVIPVGMLFVPSRNGLSHCPEEWTDYDHVAVGVSVLARALLLIDQFGL